MTLGQLLPPANKKLTTTRLVWRTATRKRAASGEEIIIAKAGTPRARLVPMQNASGPRQPGGWEEGVWVADDFDAPLPPDVLAAFEGDES